MTMRRGTTPEYTLTVDTDLTGWTCFVTISRGVDRIDLDTDRLTITDGDVEGSSEIRFTLTQRETLRMGVGTAEVQLRAIKEGIAIATDIAEIEVGRILRGGEIHE